MCEVVAQIILKVTAVLSPTLDETESLLCTFYKRLILMLDFMSCFYKLRFLTLIGG